MSTFKTIGRDLPNGDYVEITAGERDGSDGISPGFTITLLGWEKRGTWSGRAACRNGRDPAHVGADHALILEAAPELAPIVAAHLCAPDGTPMHALANGWYFYSGKASSHERRMVAAGKDYGYSRSLETSDHDRAARALHIPPANLPENMTEEQFREFAESLAPVWAELARAAREALAAMVDGDGVEGER